MLESGSAAASRSLAPGNSCSIRSSSHSLELFLRILGDVVEAEAGEAFHVAPCHFGFDFHVKVGIPGRENFRSGAAPFGRASLQH